MQHTVYLVGCGGVGSWLLPLLTRLKNKIDHKLFLFDGDSFEPKNLDRQLFPSNFVGRNKAEALAQLHGCDFKPEFFSIGWVQPAKSDWIIVAADNNAARNSALATADVSGCRVILAANEFTDSEAYLYDPAWRGTAADPRTYYPLIATDTSDDPLRAGAGCHEQTTVSPQLVVANYSAAAYAAQLYWCWLTTEIPEKHRPVHHKSNELKHTTIKLSDLLK